MTIQGETILVIEDEPQMLRFLRASLGAHGYRMAEAKSAQEGLAKGASLSPDVILLDLGLPDLDGLEVTQRFREWTKIPIIVISARGRDEDKIKALDAGADDYLTKPFSVGELLARIRVALRHVAQGRNVSMYRTNLPTEPAGRFAGPLVVTMRPLKAADAIRAVQITSRFPAVHGAPVHLGDPRLIGIADLARPDYGDAVDVLPDEIPVFWACGVTPQAALAAARPALCVTHAPGSMLVTDLRNHQLATL